MPTHAGNVDCIFIDPPYNTGNEGWAYNDNVNSPMIREWLSDNPIGLDDGLRHDKWACMMWPRLRLLHDLLSISGSLWLTLDENEIANARLILDEIFGGENFVATCIWHKADSPKNTAKFFSTDHDYILVYAKNIGEFSPNLMPRTEGMEARYQNPDNDPRGPWLLSDLAARNVYSQGLYPITTKVGRVIDGPPAGSYWRVSNEKFHSLDEDNRIWWGESGDNRPGIKRFLNEVRDGVVPQTIWGWEDVGSTRNSKQELSKIMGASTGDDLFITPKPPRLIERVIQIACQNDAIILDSFAGSGTTAHAVLNANSRDGGCRRFILVEGEEYADSLTAERVRKVIQGYSFTGTQREELLREPLTFSKLKNANTLLEKVQRIETLDGPKFDRIRPTVKDGVLVVTGERDVADKTEGLGGSFTYCTLGDPIDMDGLLTGEDLPAVEGLAALLYHTATSLAFDQSKLKPEPAIGDSVMRLGDANGRHLWLIYKPDLDWLKSGDAALTLSRARAIAAAEAGDHLVFAPAKFVSRELLTQERLPVEYAPLPFALYRVETA